MYSNYHHIEVQNAHPVIPAVAEIDLYFYLAYQIENINQTEMIKLNCVDWHHLIGFLCFEAGSVFDNLKIRVYWFILWLQIA